MHSISRPMHNTTSVLRFPDSVSEDPEPEEPDEIDIILDPELPQIIQLPTTPWPTVPVTPEPESTDIS